jgi:hypothetical protein
MTACRWVASTQPRAVVGRHDDGCTDETCRGCQPCTEPHCRVCSRVHAEGTCAECLAATRADLREIARLCDALPAEVEHRGLEGEAMVLLGPAADPEARGHLEASVACGRVPADYLDHADGELHPLFVLGTHDMVWREALDHDEPDALTLADTIDYLDRTMSYMAGFPHVPFEDFARDLRRCVAHLKGVLHDSERGVRANVSCFECGDDLERRLGKEGFEDHWTCRNPRCPRRTYTIAEFNFALRAAIEEEGA